MVIYLTSPVLLHPDPRLNEIFPRGQCDESQPECKRCRSFGVLCNFNLHIPDLQPVAADAMERLQEVVHGKAELQAPLTSAVWASDASTCYQLDAKSQDFITRYLGRGLITPDDPLMTQVNRELLKLAFDVSPYTDLPPSNG